MMQVKSHAELMSGPDDHGFLPTDRIQWAELVIMSFLVFLLFEGLFRRIAPQFGSQILAAKFVIAPAIYYMYSIRHPGWFSLRRLPVPLIAFLGVNSAVTLVYIGDEPIARVVGLCVNLLFVPLVLLGMDIFGTAQASRRLIGMLAIVCGVIGAIAVYQSFLPADHWMVVLTTGEDAIRHGQELIRVPATFQFTNTYGIFGMLSTSVGLAALVFARSLNAQVSAILLLFIALAGVFLTGSRSAGLGSIIIIAVFAFTCWARLDLWALRRALARAMLIGFAVGAVVAIYYQGASGIYEKVSAMSTSRTFVGISNNANGADRVSSRLGYYFLNRLDNAFSLGGLGGVGWGVYTQGTARFLSQYVNVETVEGGYARILVEGGVLALLSFLCLVAYLVQVVAYDRSQYQPWGATLVVSFVCMHLSLHMLQITVIAAAYWLVLGAYLSLAHMPDCDSDLPTGGVVVPSDSSWS